MPQMPGLNGGMFSKHAEQKNIRSVNYVAIEDIEKYLVKLVELGGKILTPKQHVNTAGYLALAVGSEGNPFGLL